jgi:thiazole/oxazole-forming peptide maturase SagD family component
MFVTLESMLEREEVWQKYNLWGLGPRTISQETFFEEMNRPASRFKKPLSFKEQLQLRMQQFLSKHSITKDLPLRLESGIPMNWQLILNYLYREGILETTTPIVGKFRNDKPKIPYLGFRSHYDATRTDWPERTFLGHGSAKTFDETISKAIGELLERYFGTVYNREDYFKASAREMASSGRAFLHPKDCSQFANWQKERFSDFAFTEDTPFRWIESQELVSGRNIFIPAQLTFWLYNRNPDQEPLLIPMTSNGMAGAFTRTEAIIGAIREYIERDSFLVYWLNTLSPQIIDTRDADQEIKDLEKYLRRFNIRAYFLNTTTDLHIPASTCVLMHDEGGEILLSVGAATGRTAKESLLSAYTEAVLAQSYAVGKREKVQFSLNGYEPFVRHDIGMEERTFLWQGKEMVDKARFFISGKKMLFSEFARLFPLYTNPEEELAALISKLQLASPGYGVYVNEKKHHTLETLGYYVVKVFIPRLLPMYLNEDLAPLAAARLDGVVPLLNSSGKAVRNIYPHPFP